MAFTTSKYKRLCLILFLPLLGLGILTAHTLLRFDRFVVVKCLSSLSGRANFRDVGPFDGNFHKAVNKQANSWFEVFHLGRDLNASISYLASAEGRLVRGAEIVEAEPFPGLRRDAADFMQRLVGMRVAVRLGNDGSTSVLAGNNALLSCNSVYYLPGTDLYRSECHGQGWGGPITYRVAGPEKDMLDRLDAAVKEVVEQRRIDYCSTHHHVSAVHLRIPCTLGAHLGYDAGRALRPAGLIKVDQTQSAVGSRATATLAGRIASPEMLPERGLLPHLKCSPGARRSGGGDEAGEHGDA